MKSFICLFSVCCSSAMASSVEVTEQLNALDPLELECSTESLMCPPDPENRVSVSAVTKEFSTKEEATQSALLILKNNADAECVKIGFVSAGRRLDGTCLYRQGARWMATCLADFECKSAQ